MTPPMIERGEPIPPECRCLEYGRGLSLARVHSPYCPVHGSAGDRQLEQPEPLRRLAKACRCSVCGWRGQYGRAGEVYCTRSPCQLVAAGMWTLEQARRFHRRAGLVLRVGTGGCGHDWRRVRPVVRCVGEPDRPDAPLETYNAQCARCGAHAWLHWPPLRTERKP